MVKSLNENYLNRRRGISTIVGGIIFLVLLSAGFSSFFVAMDVQTDMVNAQKSMSDLLIDKTQEQFTIAASTDVANGNRLGVQLKNSGSNPVQVEDLWIITNSGNFPASKYTIDYQDSIIPAGYGSDILENTPLFLGLDDYEIKVVSSLGTIKKVDLTVGASNNMQAELIAIPPDVKVGQNVTMIMHVENIGYSRLLNVVPFNDVTLDNYPSVTPPFTTPNPPAPVPINLDPGEGAFFEWEYITSGSAGSIVKFEGYATAQEEDTGFLMNSNVAVEKIELKIPDEIEIIVLTEDLFSRPEMFMIIPSPFGDSDENPDERAVWGVNVVNPTGNDMDVSKVVISVISPRPNSADKVFERGKCELLTVEPPGGGAGNWACSSDNQATWENLASPITVAPYSVSPFMVQVKPGSIFGNTVDIETLIVQINVFTTVGEFGKAAYGSSIDTSAAPLVNVYHSSDINSLDPSEILINQTTTANGIVVFNATLADFSTDNTIDDESRLIINIPKGWVVNQASITGPDFDPITYQSFVDTSSQIVGELDNDLVGGGAKSIKFYATAPDVCSPQMYVMYILADGTANSASANPFSLGPLSEVLLRVKPLVVCP